MIGSLTLRGVFDNVINTKFVSCVYHSAVIRQRLKGGGRSPAVPVDGRYVYIGVDDTKGFNAYCRQLGPLEVMETVNVGGCDSRLYKTKTLFRLVFFNNSEERSHEEITSKLASAVVGSHKVQLSKIHLISEDVLKVEATGGQFEFTAKTFYIAIDFFVLLDIRGNKCPEDIDCETTENPYQGNNN